MSKLRDISADELINRSKPYDKSFYERDVVKVSRDLLGSILVHEFDSTTLAGFIVETEAYHESEPACHAHRKKTKRNEIMFGPGGFSYVYFVYGMYWCLNATAEHEGCGAACLIRAIEPIKGIELMQKARKQTELADLCSGPGKLTVAFSLNGKHNGLDLTKSNLRILCPPDNLKPSFSIRKSARIGINAAHDLEYRYYIYANPCVSNPSGVSKSKTRK